MAENNTDKLMGTFYCEGCGGYYNGDELRDDGRCQKGHVVKKISKKPKNELWPEKAIPTRP